LQVGARAVVPLDFFHRLRIVGLNPRAGSPQRFQQDPAGGFTDVIGVGLERQPPQGKHLAPQAIGIMPLDLAEQPAFLMFVDRLHRTQQLRLEAFSFGAAAQGLQVLGEA